MPIINPVVSPSEGRFEQVAQSPLAPLIARMWQTMVVLGALLVIVYMVWGAFDWLTSAGEPDKLKSARQKIMDAVVGLGFLVISFAIVKFMGFVFGFDLLKITWPTP